MPPIYPGWVFGGAWERSSMAEHDLAKVDTRVRFPSLPLGCLDSPTVRPGAIGVGWFKAGEAPPVHSSKADAAPVSDRASDRSYLSSTTGSCVWFWPRRFQVRILGEVLRGGGVRFLAGLISPRRGFESRLRHAHVVYWLRPSSDKTVKVVRFHSWVLWLVILSGRGLAWKASGSTG